MGSLEPSSSAVSNLLTAHFCWNWIGQVLLGVWHHRSISLYFFYNFIFHCAMLFSFPSSYWEIEITHHYSLIVFLFSSCCTVALLPLLMACSRSNLSFYLTRSTARMYIHLTKSCFRWKYSFTGHKAIQHVSQIFLI